MRPLTRISLAFLFVAQLTSIGLAQSGIITTYAGPALPINGTQATTQSIDSPASITSDGTGGFYVASSSQNRVYRVAADGRLNLVAGIGSPGFSGDGGPAISAKLWSPTGVAVDAAGDLFIADSYNNRVRKVTHQIAVRVIELDGLGSRDLGHWSGTGRISTGLVLQISKKR